MKGFGGMQQLMRQANQMQSKMKKLQAELAERKFEGQSGGGAVKVSVGGDNLLQSVAIQQDVFSEGDAEMLQDLILAAANDAIQNAKKTSEEEMSKVTGGMNMPGMF